MLAIVHSATPRGIDAVDIHVEVDMALGLPYFNVVGLPDGAAKESKVRVISALKNSGFELPSKRITVNLAPADIRKEGAAFELPIAVGVLVAAGLLETTLLDTYAFAGELSLDGRMRPVRGVLPMAVWAKSAGFRGFIVPSANAAEAALVEGLEVIAVPTLQQAVQHASGAQPIAPFSAAAKPATHARADALDMRDVRGQEEVKNALELAAAGGHNALLCGPPGSGKTMLAQRLPGLLPEMDFSESLEVTKIYSVVGLLRGEGLVGERPFRSPHHTISDIGLVGGGTQARPGELSLAHRGVLFLDELPEFRKNVLEVMRQPLEEGMVHLARANQHWSYPSRFMLVAAMNPCPCGYFNTSAGRCTCVPRRVMDYHARVSGPLLDRIDIGLQTHAVAMKQLSEVPANGRGTEHYRSRVEAARARQRARFSDSPAVLCNAQMGPPLLSRHCALTSRSRKLLDWAMRKYGLSARAHDRILKLARTRADLEGHDDIRDEDLQIAIDCRVLDRKDWLSQNLHGGLAVDSRQETEFIR